jgi:hypothetical protein
LENHVNKSDITKRKWVETEHQGINIYLEETTAWARENTMKTLITEDDFTSNTVLAAEITAMDQPGRLPSLSNFTAGQPSSHK